MYKMILRYLRFSKDRRCNERGVYVCMYVCMYVRMYVCMCMNISMYVYHVCIWMDERMNI